MNKMMEQIFGEEARAFDEAFKIIGEIAIEHAKIEEMLDYLLWQLTCYEISLRRGSTAKPKQELQSLFRRTRQTINRAHRVMSQRVSLISKQLAQPRIMSRLAEITLQRFCRCVAQSSVTFTSRLRKTARHHSFGNRLVRRTTHSEARSRAFAAKAAP
jgi:hypothetical protein